MKAPAQLTDGTIVPRDNGTPQGGVASPLLANIFLHHVLDLWLADNYPHSPFERYADDGALQIRRWQIQRKSDRSLEDLASMYNHKIRGWINYYGKYYKSALYPTFRLLNRRLVRWVRKKYKRRRFHRKATRWLREIARKEPGLFAHWSMGAFP